MSVTGRCYSEPEPHMASINTLLISLTSLQNSHIISQQRHNSHNSLIENLEAITTIAQLLRISQPPKKRKCIG